MGKVVGWRLALKHVWQEQTNKNCGGRRRSLAVSEEVMSIVVDVNRVSDICESSSRRTRDESVFEKLKKAAGHIEELYKLIAEEQNILGHFDEVPFCETPLHVAAENGKTHFAMELLTLKPSLALKLNVSGFSPVHLALQNFLNKTKI
ncbi:hypothetical protein Bca52824_079368 [Brassica carinata]|uniref:Uncharacterized protein n=1 Tax=Brassica carinata TaxID=52824 RepID=A0A8X7PX80_BRACI|nr:hypothetical protein Bca52824_079368 [Brassica carinata]